MKHLHTLGAVPPLAQGEGLCTNITGDLQARYCFILAFFADVFVPLIQPFILVKTSDAVDVAEGEAEI